MHLFYSPRRFEDGVPNFEKKKEQSQEKVKNVIEKIVLCTICGQTFKRKHHLVRHVEIIHEKLRKYQCNLCQKKFKEKHHLKKHFFKSHNGLDFEWERDYNQTEKISTSPKERCPCTLCGKTFLNATHLKRHIESVHEKIRKYPCFECPKRFKQQTHLKEHIKLVHDKKKRYNCSICGKNFHKKINLQEHILLSSEEGKCKIDFENDDTLPEPNLEFPMDWNGQDISKFINKCTVCGKIFSSKSHLKRHVESVHEKLKRFQCDFCEKKYYQKSHLQEHVLAAHKDFDNENMLLVSNSEWENEENYTKEFSMSTIGENISDPVKKSPECTLCGKTFRSKGHVKRHIESVHEKLKKHQCDMCEKKYYQKSHLKEHIQFVHSGFEDEVVLSEANLEGQ